MSNGFTGHIVPQNGEYYHRADSVAAFTVVESAKVDGVLLSWSNPSSDLNGDALTSIESITIRRNNQVIATLTEVQPGEAMTFEDDELAPGLYEYAIFVTNEAGISRNVYRKILVGEKCDVVFELHDEGGDGWKGAAISVTTGGGQRIAVIGMTEGSEQTVTVPLIKENLSFIWNHGWYHTQEQYDTDYECSFAIRGFEGNLLYESGELVDGVFMTMENNCEYAPLVCYPVENLQGEYQWNNAGEFGYRLTWDAPAITTNLDHFMIYSDIATKEPVIVPFTGDASYEYVYLTGESGDYAVSVTSVYKRGESTCESEDAGVDITVTDLNENTANLQVYPNPTSGQVQIEGQGAKRIVVTNLLGQKLLELETQGNTSIDLGRFGHGVYLLRIDTANGPVLQKVSVRK